MITQVSKYSDVRVAAKSIPRPTRQPASGLRRRSAGSAPSAPALLIPKHTELVNWEEWLWKELRDGGRLREYLRCEKATSQKRLRSVARQMHGRQQNNKSDWRLLAAVPAREFQRWKHEDPNFWDDNANLKSFRRDNPDACVFL